MDQLHNAGIGQADLAQAGNVCIGDILRAEVHLQGKLHNRFQARVGNRRRTLSQKLLGVGFVGPQAVIQNRTKSRRAVGTAVGLGNGNADVLNFRHGELAQLPQDLGCAELGLEQFREVQLNIEVIGHRSFHVGDPTEDFPDDRIVNTRRFIDCHTGHTSPPVDY